MIIISWNCWGLGNQCIVDVPTNVVRSKGPIVLFLLETKRFITEMRKLCYDLNFQAVMVVPSDSQSGGLGLFWKAECDLHIQTFFPNHIDAHIRFADKSPWRIKGFYGRPEGHQKHESWRILRHLHARASLPWVCIGDYNEILHFFEKHGPKTLSVYVGFQRDLVALWAGRPRVPWVPFHLA